MPRKRNPAQSNSGTPSPLANNMPYPIVRSRDPVTGDKADFIGQEWVNKSSNGVFIATSVAAGATNWATTSGTGISINTLTDTANTVVSPTAGNVKLAGTANQITVTAGSSLLTWTLPAAITAPGSLTTTTSLASTTTMTAGTGLTVTAGNATLTAGNVVINGAGKQLQVHGGAVTDFVGQATLVAGTVDVANTNIAAGDRILVTRSAKNGSTAYGTFLTTITAATKFNITACKSDTTTETNDASTVDYVIVRQV